MKTGAPDEAVALYRGTFLEGLHVEGAATDFEDWLDRERGRLRREAAGAATSMLERAEREGQAPAAAAWGRRAVALMPDDESALRRLLALLDRAGDRAGAVQAYEEFTRRLAEELELAPSPETWALAESIRTRRGASAGSETTIAVLPFAVRGDSRLAYLGEGMVDLLATKLDGAGAIRTVDPRALLRFLARPPQGSPTTRPPASREAAEHFGAGHYLLGSVVESAGRIEVMAALYRTDGTRWRRDAQRPRPSPRSSTWWTRSPDSSSRRLESRRALGSR